LGDGRPTARIELIDSQPRASGVDDLSAR